MSTIDEKLLKAQWGEDRLLWDIFRQRRSGFYIEVGAWNGLTFSNTYFLEQMGWTGILIEPLPERYVECAENRPDSLTIHAACVGNPDISETTFNCVEEDPMLSCIKTSSKHEQRCSDSPLRELTVPASTLDAIISRSRSFPWKGTSPWLPNQGWSIDLVSIDVEGTEIEVLSGFSLERFKPKVLLIENEQPQLSGLDDYLSKRGYVRVGRNVINDFFVPTELAPD